MKRVEERLQAHEAKMLDLVERRLEAFEKALTAKLLASIDITIEKVVTKIMEKVDPLTRTLVEQSGTKRKERKTLGDETAAEIRSTAPNDRHQAGINCHNGSSHT
ncbi:hypothetical protein HPB51_007471 [Rhipicephalus microplus]|uniref:Uncharacterized protein n=1 Tax=Rhipicephalus microplus TaxID=6941 RepID=A0A9J6F005_RHIMP|nr:hypothetical protein HPB51_007471 [Rhipicephalus microplus]